MPDTPSIVVIKRFTYRGISEEFGNRYHFSGTTPTDIAGWKTLADAIIANEQGTVSAAVSWVRAYGYVAGNDNTVAVIDYTIAPNVVIVGNGAFTSSQQAPGDAAAWIRYATPNFNTKGKRIYLRKYMHCVFRDVSNPDLLLPAQKTALGTFAAKLIDGTLPGTFRYCGPQGAVASAPTVSTYLTTRTLKRRGKRPPT